ncbi:MAG TPA: ACT domain-containing protein [Candidatus Omnitrophota bacterium]|nr:ACT domain-containing protein [Candidatus Omnitrophota bacterium]
MKLNQISIFLENREGRLYEACSLLGEHKINIRALTIAESDQFGILRVVVDKPEEAMALLKKNGFTADLTDIVAVEVDDKPGGLAKILKIIYDNRINIEYMYGFVEKSSEKALLVFRFDDSDKAISVLTDNKIKVIGKKDIVNL